MDKDQIQFSNQQINPVKQQLTFPLDKTSQDIIRNYGGGEAFPIGSVFISVVTTDPSILLGYGTWSAFATGQTLVGYDSGDSDFDTLEATGGEKTHTLITSEMPSHNHATNPFPMTLHSGTSKTGLGSSNVGASDYLTGDTGGDGAHNNLQPYIVVYFWKRTS